MIMTGNENEEFTARTENALETDSQNSCDHSCWPEDPQVGDTWSPKKE